jgi:hypothetical protein
MRPFAIVAAFCTFAYAVPAEAFGLAFCDAIKDDQARMACLQEHISHLEETIVALSGRIATLENALDHKLGADVTYKVQSTGGKCLGIAGDPPAPSLADCDSGDSWKMLAGAPVKKPEKPAPPPPPPTPQAPAAAEGAVKPANPCRGLDQVGCGAKPDLCAWKPDKNRCGRK